MKNYTLDQYSKAKVGIFIVVEAKFSQDITFQFIGLDKFIFSAFDDPLGNNQAKRSKILRIFFFSSLK